MNSIKRIQEISCGQVDALFDVLPLTWSCWKRLYELRENLYEPVKDMGPTPMTPMWEMGFKAFSRHASKMLHHVLVNLGLSSIILDCLGFNSCPAS
jgi:hypothetical protein